MAKPPKGVVMVCEAVNILLGEKPDWDNCKRVIRKLFYHSGVDFATPPVRDTSRTAEFMVLHQTATPLGDPDAA